MRKGGADQIRLSCRHVWKVYGEGAQGSVPDDGIVDDVDEHIQKLQADGFITAACDISFDVYQGEIFVIMGLSGSGKSTVIRCLSRLVEPTAGSVMMDNLDLLQLSDRELTDVRRHKMGMVFQNFGLLPHLNVLDNVAYPLRVQGMPRSEREAQAREMIELVGLDGREKAFPLELSGGMQQRVGIARSLAVEPDIWFLDEPFSALDPLIRRQMQDEFLRLQEVLQKTIVFITHDFLEALRVADRIAIMRDGMIVQVDTPSNIVLNPAEKYVAEFTRDVPRVKVVTAGNICEPVSKGLDTSDAVNANDTLEVILPRLAGRGKPLAVMSSNGKIKGQVTGDKLLRELAALDREL